jgi:hypothetical protein
MGNKDLVRFQHEFRDRTGAQLARSLSGNESIVAAFSMRYAGSNAFEYLWWSYPALRGAAVRRFSMLESFDQNTITVSGLIIVRFR